MSRRLVLVLTVVYFAAGAGIGLAAGWGWQMQDDGCTISDLAPEVQQDLLLSVALARPTQRSEVRCAFPGWRDDAIADAAERSAVEAMSSGGDEASGPALVALAALFGRQRPDLLVYTSTLGSGDSGTPETVSPTPIPVATSPAATPPPLPFTITRLQAACDATEREHQVQVRVIGRTGEGIRGREVRLEWEGGGQRALTGLKSPAAYGYADFVLEAGAVYQLHLASPSGGADSRVVALSVAAANCSGSEKVLWFVDFSQRGDTEP